jgi:transcriptional regulator with XRE-family HTH domain
MARTPGIRVSPEHIQTVKQTLYRCFPRQIDLAEALGISRSTVTSYFNGKSVSPTNFIEISNKLGLDWQAIMLTQRLAIAYPERNKCDPNPLLLSDEIMQEYAWFFEQKLLVILIAMLRENARCH